MIKLKNYKKELEAIEEELRKLPDGKLKKRRNFYYHVIEGKEIGITHNTKLIRQLCRKRYLQALKKRLDKNISIISRIVDKLDNTTYEGIINTLPASFQDLPSFHFHHSSIQPWLEKPYKENSHKGRKYETKRGILVRSKSELMIANLLEDYDIPYRYEDAITLDEQTKYPDFVIKHPFSGKTIIWEHFGALHQPGYEQEMNKKMELYLANGWISFETLIYTFEFDINTRRLKDLIENIILAD